jgi:CBS domain-containing protein
MSGAREKRTMRPSTGRVFATAPGVPRAARELAEPRDELTFARADPCAPRRWPGSARQPENASRVKQSETSKERIMNVDQCMTRDPMTCRASDSLERAAQLMWENDCGCVPVLDESAKLIGIITDRDICMAAYTRGAHLGMLSVESTMARKVVGCLPGDTLATALRTMRTRQVRRLPVLDAQDGVVGLISLTDIARQAGARGRSKSGLPSADEVLAAVAGIGCPRDPEDATGFDGGRARAEPNGRLKDVLQPKGRPAASRPMLAGRTGGASKSGKRSR